MKVKFFFVSGLAAALCCGTFSAKAQITQASGIYKFRYKYTKGQVLKYGMQMSIKGADNKPLVADQKINLTISVTGVDAKGNATLKITTDGVMGQKPADQKLVISPTGKVISGVDPGLGSFATFPDKGLKIGESWTHALSVPGGGGKINAKYTLKSVGNVAGKQVATISIVMSSANAQYTMSGTGSQHISVSDCSLVDSIANVSTKIGTGTKAMTAKSTISMKRK